MPFKQVLVKIKMIVEIWPLTHRLRYYSTLLKYVLSHNFDLFKRLSLPEGIVLLRRGLKWYIDPQYTIDTTEAMFIDTKEPETYAIFRNLEGKVFVDVGANAGGYVLRGQKNFTNVIALEPNPSVFYILKENIFLNSASNITALNIASSDKKGLASLYEPSVKSGKAGTSATLRPDVMSASHGLTYGSSVRVRADTLDNILKDTDAVDLLMIDVEGAEVEVLVGAENLLKKTKMLIVEVRPATRRKVMELVGKYFVVKELDDHKEWVNLWGTSKN